MAKEKKFKKPPTQWLAKRAIKAKLMKEWLEKQPKQKQEDIKS